MSTQAMLFAPLLRRARTQLEAANHDEVYKKNEMFSVAQSMDNFGAGTWVSIRFADAKALYAAIAADDLTVLVFGIQLLQTVAPEPAMLLALEAINTDLTQATDLDQRVLRSAAMVVSTAPERAPLDNIVRLILSGAMLSPPQNLLSHPELQQVEARRALARRLERMPSDKRTSASELRAMVLKALCSVGDGPTLQWLFEIWRDPEHPFSDGALQWLPHEKVAPLLDDPSLAEKHKAAVLHAALQLADVDRLVSFFAPRMLDSADAASLLHAISSGLRSARLPNNDPHLAAFLVPLLERPDLKDRVKGVLALMDKKTVNAASRPAKPASASKGQRSQVAATPEKAAPQPTSHGGATYLSRYEAGEHREVWNELRALGAAVRSPTVLPDARAVAEATMKRFGQNIEAIVAVLRRAKYPFASKKPLAAARADIEKKLGGVVTLVGPLPLAVEVFYCAFDGVDLGQKPDALIPSSNVFSPGALDEMGRYDPLLVVPFSTLESEAKAIAKRNKGRASALQDPLYPYLSPEPRSKGMGDEIADENPVRLVPDSGVDARLSGAHEGMFFVDWLRSYVQAGGFLSLNNAGDRALLTKNLVAF